MNDKKIIELYSENKKSMTEIADMYNTYPNKIRRLLIKNGVRILSKSETQKQALKNGRAKIPTEGKTRTKEERLKISESLKKTWESISEEEYKKRVDLAKQRWQSMSEEEKESMQRLSIQAIQKAGKEGSKLEKFLKTELSKRGLKIEIHKKNLIPNENLEIDMFFPELKTTIEIDGPSHFLPIWGDEKLQKQIKSDSHKTGLILSKGYAIIRVKHLSDSLCLISREKLKNRLLEILTGIEKSFPSKSERYIEIEA